MIIVSLSDSLATFNAGAAQCESLISNAHMVDAAGNHLLPEIDRKQITCGAFLNLFVAWETFLEDAFAKFMIGEPTITGRTPVKFAAPANIVSAKKMIIGVNRYFDFGNHELVKRMACLYFDGGEPFEPHLSSILSDLADLRTMRNASAHLTSTTQSALESLAQRIFSTPRPRIDLYTMLTSGDPASTVGNTVFAERKGLLLAAAQLIAT